MTEYIYHLIDPRDERIRYVGKSVNPYQRLISHMTGCSTDPCGKWNRELKEFDREPIMRIVAICKRGAFIRERNEITSLVRSGESLLNVVCRGEKRDRSKFFRHATCSVRTRLLVADEKSLTEIARNEPSNVSNLIARIVHEWLALQAGKKK